MKYFFEPSADQTLPRLIAQSETDVEAQSLLDLYISVIQIPTPDVI